MNKIAHLHNLFNGVSRLIGGRSDQLYMLYVLLFLSLFLSPGFGGFTKTY